MKRTLAALCEFPDFDVLYIWLGDVRRQLHLAGEPQQTYLEGIEQCRRKKFLYAEMGNAELKSANLGQAVMWWIRSCLVKNNEAYAYLNLAYVAEGLGLHSQYTTLLKKADSMPDSTVRFNSEGANERYRLAAAQGNDDIKIAIIKLCKAF